MSSVSVHRTREERAILKRDSRAHCYGLVLTGGGARGAYQAGVLKALAKISPTGPVPFPVLTGVSVGGLNTIGLASHFDDFATSVDLIEAFWAELRTDRVFRTGWWTLGKSASLYLAAALFPRIVKHPHRAFLDNAPLRAELSQTFQFDRIAQSVKSHGLRAIGLTCSGYTSGHAVTFFDAIAEVTEWQRVRRHGQRCTLSLEHAMASAALPLLFEAVLIEDEFFGDGHLRLTSPLAPAIHLGADRILVIATRDGNDEAVMVPDHKASYPSLADFGGYGLDTIFHDTLDADIERLTGINETIGLMSKDTAASLALRNIETLILNPSCSLQELAKCHDQEMPRSLQWLFGGKQSESSAGRLESYLLFESGYINSLMQLGYQDTMFRQEEIRLFLSIG